MGKATKEETEKNKQKLRKIFREIKSNMEKAEAEAMKNLNENEKLLKEISQSKIELAQKENSAYKHFDNFSNDEQIKFIHEISENFMNFELRVTLGRIKVKDEIFGAEIAGPSLGLTNKINNRKSGSVDLESMVELSAGKAGVNAGPAFIEANLNANTGTRINNEGVELNFLGFGFAVGRKTAINTPFGALGFK